MTSRYDRILDALYSVLDLSVVEFSPREVRAMKNEIECMLDYIQTAAEEVDDRQEPHEQEKVGYLGQACPQV